MLRKSMLATFLLALTACATTSETHTPASARGDARLVGTWELVSTKISNAGRVIVEGAPPEMRSLKILNGTDFSVVTRRGDQFLRAAAGRYTLNSNTYTESVDLASGMNFTPGRVYTFQITVNGDTWTLDGGADGQLIQEVWRRVR